MGRFSRLETGKTNGSGQELERPEIIDPAEHYPAADAQPIDPSLDAPACLRRGHEAMVRDFHKDAMRWYSRALDMEPRLLDAWVGMIRTHTIKGELSQASVWIGRGLSVFPDSPALMALKAVNLARRGLLRQALTGSDAALERAPTLALAHLARGEVLVVSDNRNFDFCFEQALKLSPALDWLTPFVAGMILEERRLWTRALVYYSHSAERNESNPALWYHVARCRIALGHAGKAERALAQARELCAPDDRLIHKIEALHGGSAAGRFLRRVRGMLGLR